MLNSIAISNFGKDQGMPNDFNREFYKQVPRVVVLCDTNNSNNNVISNVDTSNITYTGYNSNNTTNYPVTISPPTSISTINSNDNNNNNNVVYLPTTGNIYVTTNNSLMASPNIITNSPPQLTRNTVEKKYKTLLPAVQCSKTSNNIESDLKSKLDNSALKYLAGIDINKYNTNNINNHILNIPYSYEVRKASRGSNTSLSSIKDFGGILNNDLATSQQQPIVTQGLQFNSANQNPVQSLPLQETVAINKDNKVILPNSLPKKAKRAYRTKKKGLRKAKKIKKETNSDHSEIPAEVNTVDGNNMIIQEAVSDRSKYIELRRRHICAICNKGFTTSGHLARHNRIHTGERNHICPYKGCKQKFSRQDNCLQHYKTHLKNYGKVKKNELEEESNVTKSP